MTEVVGRLDELPESYWQKYATLVVSSINDAAVFQNSTQETQVLADAAEALKVAEAKHLKAAQAESQAKAAVREAKAAIRGALRDVVNYVNAQAQGDVSKLIASGLPLKRPKRRSSDPAQRITSVKATNGKQSGTVKLSWRSAGRGHLYRVEATRTPNDASSWELLDTVSISSPSFKIGIDEEGVNRAQAPRYYFRVSARNSKGGWSDWSDPVSIYLT